MLKCIAICPKGYDRCCFNCQLIELCKDSCRTDNPEECKMHVHSEEIRAENRTRETANRFLKLYIIGLVAFLVLLFALMVVIGNQNAEAIRDRDILDKLNLIDQSIDTSQENRSQGEIEALTMADRALIERVTMSESGGESLEAQMAVAQTIYDRMHDFGDTLQEAIQTYSQKDNGAPTDSVKLAVENVFDKGARVYEGGTYQFHDDSVLPYWTEGKITRGSIGNLRFYGGYENVEDNRKPL
jgi:hypothetical protein